MIVAIAIALITLTACAAHEPKPKNHPDAVWYEYDADNEDS